MAFCWWLRALPIPRWRWRQASAPWALVAETQRLVSTTFGGLLTATATDSTAANGIVYQDLSPDYGGLGVVSLSGDKAGKPAITSSDQIERGEALKLSFTQQVSVVGFHFFDGDHGLTRSGDFARLSIDGGAWQDLSLHPNYVTNDPNRWYTGTSFEFKWGNQDFYLGAIKITTSIPEAPSVALMLAGLLALGAAVEWTKRARLGATRS